MFALATRLNYFFTAVFIFEMFIKVFGLGLKLYVSDIFNVADGLITILSIVELIMEFTSGSNSNDGA